MYCLYGFFFWFNFIYLFFQLFILRFIDMFDYMSGSALSLSLWSSVPLYEHAIIYSFFYWWAVGFGYYE